MAAATATSSNTLTVPFGDFDQLINHSPALKKWFEKESDVAVIYSVSFNNDSAENERFDLYKKNAYCIIYNAIVEKFNKHSSKSVYDLTLTFQLFVKQPTIYGGLKITNSMEFHWTNKT